jgi:hypothetical protein
MVSLKHATTTLLLLGLAMPVLAKITCCDVNGHRTCGDPPPPQCINKTKTIFSQGGVAKEIEAPLTAEQKAARDAEDARKKEEAKIAAEQARKDRALMASYTTEKEIDAARDRALKEIERNIEQAKNRLETARKKKEKLDQEKEFYLKKPMPASLKAQVKDNDSEIAAQEKTLQQADDDIAAAKARFDADKTRFHQLSGKK